MENYYTRLRRCKLSQTISTNVGAKVNAIKHTGTTVLVDGADADYIAFLAVLWLTWMPCTQFCTV